MVWFKKERGARPTTNIDGRAVYKQVAVRPRAHAKLQEIADRTHSSIVDTVDNILGL